jgi:erythromycin esterase-like protein
MLFDEPRAQRLAPHEITGSQGDYDELLERIGGRGLVLIGEASHGTHEFYRERARLTRKLIEEHGFCAVAAEADWPDAYRVNRYLHGAPEDADAEEALRGFRRFPTWMWRNAEVLDFVGWLRAHNERAAGAGAGFFGLDVYSLFSSIAAVVDYLDRVDPEAAARARERYACFEQFGGEQGYGQATTMGIAEPCRQGVIDQLLELSHAAGSYLRRDGIAAEDEQFCAEQNARVVAGAEAYYRSMFGHPAASWNLRDRHMADTLERLAGHLARHGRPPKIVVWEHNSHVGDARATEMSRAREELNVGQLIRERHPREAFLVGFSTFAGTVTAASSWDAPAERKRVRPAMPESWEELLHRRPEPAYWLDLSAPEATQGLEGVRLERAIGVIYRPETERQSHYFFAELCEQFDALIHIDETRAVEPLERSAGWELGEPPETYPTAL